MVILHKLLDLDLLERNTPA